MRNLLLTFITSILFISATSQSLPPVAQALYNEACNRDCKRVQYAIDNGVQIMSTPDSNSFYLKWFPAGADPSKSPLIVTLHGSSGYAFDEFFLWHKKATRHGCGIIALQWYRGPSAASPNDYFNDEIIYSYIDSALTSIGYPAGKAFLHGFSRGAARSYAIAFNDLHGGKNYFCTVLSNAGAANPGYPLYAKINTGKYGNNVFTGRHWSLYCGGLDPNASQSGCNGMNSTKKWLEDQGATVDLFIQDAGLGHGGFHQTAAHMDSALTYYLKCFNGAIN